MSTVRVTPVIRAVDLHKDFERGRDKVCPALEGISFSVVAASLTALVGPDGAGKTTLARLIAGLLTADRGQLTVLGLDAATQAEQIQARIGYMPQRFGLYEDLTVEENLNLYADLHGVSQDERGQRYPKLLEMTALEPFTGRLAGRLSGGMKQKLGLACTLVRRPELLLLDEPTAGVDPLSRRELWEIILDLVAAQELTVLVATSNLEEADRCHDVVVLNQGRILAQGSPQRLTAVARGHTFRAQPPRGQKARVLQAQLLDDPQVVDAVPEGGRVRVVLLDGRPVNGDSDKLAIARDLSLSPVEPRFEDAFMVLLRRSVESAGHVAVPAGPAAPLRGDGSDVVVEVRNLVRRFGDFTAVDHITFEVRRGEVFGLLGPNGAGKTTTFRMLCGLLAATAGTLRVAGVDLRRARASARQRIGYVAQKFALYGQLSVIENLEFFASAYGLRGARRRERIDWALAQFELEPQARSPSEELPGGYKRRLAMAAALLHEPQIVFLDEPTSGADPLARREFWRRITLLGEQGVTIVVTTHFMEEAEYCDRLVIMDAGRVLAQGSPAEVSRLARPQTGREPTMEDAFIAIIEQARQEAESSASGAQR